MNETPETLTQIAYDAFVDMHEGKTPQLPLDIEVINLTKKSVVLKRGDQQVSVKEQGK